MPGKRVTVVVADDHPLYREGLMHAIGQRPDLKLLGAAADGRTGLEMIRALAPAVALLDVKMPGLDGLQVLNAIRRDDLPTSVVLVSAHVASDLVYHAIVGGASAFLSKEADRDEICDAVAAAARGEMHLAADVQGYFVHAVQLRARNDLPRLTARESEVLGMIADGLSAPLMAERLTLSTATVKSHLQKLYDKLSVSDRAAAVAKAMRLGLLE
ncbi:MAG: response regulator transcription factor [Solirubrobacterales bacterium]